MRVKQTIHVLLASLFIAQAMNNLFVLASFKLNQSYLEKHACVNRSKVGSKCHAHCQLKKQLSEKHQQERKLPVKLKEEQQWLLYFSWLKDNAFESGLDERKFSLYQPREYVCNASKAALHPPEPGFTHPLFLITKS